MNKNKYYPKTEIEKKLFDSLRIIVKSKFGEEHIELIELEHPADPRFGDFSTNIAMKLAGKLGKNPREVAQEIVNEWADELFETPSIEGPGFVNFFVNKETLANELVNISSNEKYGVSSVNDGKKYMVEFSQPNPMKAFHIGHLKGTLYGESLSRILEGTGIDVVRANYQGDVGLHIAKVMWAVMKEYPDGLPEDLENKSLKDRISFIQDLYVKGNKAFEESDEVKEEVYKRNKEVNEQAESVQPYYQPFRQWSIDKFDEIYKRLGTHFDRSYYESEMIEPGIKHVEEAVKKGILEKEESGAVVFRGEDHGLHTRVFITGKGFPTYEAKDLELGYLESTEFGEMDKHLFIIGGEQREYLQVVFKVRELLFGDLLKDRQEHLVNGFVSVKGMKMSSRLGNVVLGEDVLNEAVERISKIVEERDYSEEEKRDISEVLGVGAVKYSILKNNPNKDTIFDIEESISVEGQSAPYIMYAYTRAKSILEEAGGDVTLRQAQGDIFSTDSEMAILRTLYIFPEIVQLAAEKYAPNYVADYIFDLAQKFNTFYRECPVLKAEEEVKNIRLALTAAVAQVVKNGLYLLGIETLERM